MHELLGATAELAGDPDEGVDPQTHARADDADEANRQTAALNARLLSSLKASLDAADARGHGCAMFGEAAARGHSA